jgi:hypothetical protein
MSSRTPGSAALSVDGLLPIRVGFRVAHAEAFDRHKSRQAHTKCGASYKNLAQNHSKLRPNPTQSMQISGKYRTFAPGIAGKRRTSLLRRPPAGSRLARL